MGGRLSGVEITAETRVVAVIGSPVRHSLSPTIHNAAFAATGLDWVYTAFDVSASHGGAAVGAMRTFGLAGLNVTMPHKEAVAASVDALTPVAEALGAVNCVYWDGDRLVGDNTDGTGFVDALRADAGVEPSAHRCVVVGAGAAGRAVAWALGQAGAADVAVVNRNRQRAELAAGLAGAVGRVGAVADLGDADLVVNATPLGMGGSGDGAEQAELPFAAGALHNGHVVVDLIYHPASTPLLEAARGAGAVAVNGLGMLVHQAGQSFARWTGREAPIQVMLDAADVELGRRG